MLASCILLEDVGLIGVQGAAIFTGRCAVFTDRSSVDGGVGTVVLIA
ncbi:hypothetical protein [Gluconacetobacter takamatsuzukensis]|uniref:Uncharacterized protein n=1 Tax=Gluconacetobacter takamatsuzukensis TaxID=1286190 RepID=A0A7W4KF31_9PROT|nr:hypothetical protein [Gluconacetobacter takamatsuzukensis]MBB2205728.1 hypothetical protein [Gluconacetobacter takamatsuzukensis]